MTLLHLALRLLALTLLLALPSRAERIGPAAEMAINLAGVSDWSVQQPFLDVMKTARTWVGHRPGQWGGHEIDALRARGLLDRDGWPVAVPGDLRAIGTIVLTDLPPEAVSVAGNYRLTYDGDGILEVWGRAQNVRYGKGEITFDFTPGEGGVIVDIRRTDRRRTGDYIRNIRIVKQEHAAALDAGALFNPDWTNRISAFGTLRFMDWMATNDSRVSAWDERPKVGDATWAEKGVPVEIIVALANELGFDIWVCMPHLATDRYMTRFASYVRDHLDPALTVYVEFSNEVWNWQFEQARWAEAQARQRWQRDHAGFQYYGVRAAEMAAIWRKVFGPDVAARLTLVAATQTGWLGRETDMLDAPLFRAEAAGRAAPAAAFDAYAVTGYFSALLGHEEKAGLVRAWLADSLARAEAEAARRGLTGAAREGYVAAHRFDHAVEMAVRELRDGSVSGDAADTLAALLHEVLPYQREVADRHGLDLIMYEGGTHVVAAGALTGDPELSAFFIHLNYTPEMGGLYRELLAGWAAAGGRLFNAFNDVYKPNVWGSWGHLRHLDDETPRWTALTSAVPEQ